MKKKQRLDESLSIITFKKQMTGESPTTIDISKIKVENGEIVSNIKNKKTEH